MSDVLRRVVVLTAARPTSSPTNAPDVAGTPAEALAPNIAPPPTDAPIPAETDACGGTDTCGDANACGDADACGNARGGSDRETGGCIELTPPPTCSAAPVPKRRLSCPLALPS